MTLPEIKILYITSRFALPAFSIEVEFLSRKRQMVKRILRF